MEPEVLRGEFDTLLLDNSGGQEGERNKEEWRSVKCSAVEWRREECRFCFALAYFVDNILVIILCPSYFLENILFKIFNLWYYLQYYINHIYSIVFFSIVFHCILNYSILFLSIFLWCILFFCIVNTILFYQTPFYSI